MASMNSSQQKAKSFRNRLADLFSGDWRTSSLYVVIFSASVSLVIFTRFLDFFFTPTINKIFVFICLFVFFLLLSVFFVLPIIHSIAVRRKALLIIILISSVATVGFFFLLPEQKFTSRTLHTLEISMSADSGSVVLGKLTGPTNESIPWEDLTFDGTTSADLIAIPPGGELSYSREMTGGLSFVLSATEKDSMAVITWDGTTVDVPIPVGENVNWKTDPTSLGKPSKSSQYILLTVKANEWFSLFLVLNLLLSLLYLIFRERDYSYQTFLQNAQRYLLDYQILGGILLLVAIGYRAFKPESPTINMEILLPGLVYLLLKILYRVVPSLPIILFSLIFIVNIFGHWVWFDDRLLHVRKMEDQTFNSLATLIFPSDTTVLSLGFYKQLRNSELVVAVGSYLSEDDNINRLIRLNYHKHIYVLDYRGELTTEEYERLLKVNGWSTWNRSAAGKFYFYQADQPVTSPIVAFTYEDDIFLIPLDQLDELGLLNDFVFD